MTGYSGTPLARKLGIKEGHRVWLGWPKKACGVPTDLTEALVRAYGLRDGSVDDKVCAIDETWAGLRFVVRVADRPR